MPRPKVSKMDIQAEVARWRILTAVAIQEVRKAAGLTQRQLADRLGVTAPAVAQHESGAKSMSTRTLAKYGLACGVHFKLEVVK